MNLPESWVRALEQPVLSVTSPYTLRLNLARLLRTESRAEAAVISGLRSDLPATAFLCGYQTAMRFVDPALAPEQWAAFCISEKNLSSLRDMQTTFSGAEVSGVKSHAMLMDKGIDWLYIVAKDKDGLACRRLSAAAKGLSVLPSSGAEQPFIPELPHNGVRFNRSLTDTGYYRGNAHEKLNKPFRYHEDILGLLALSGWMIRMRKGGENAGSLDELAGAVKRLIMDYDDNSVNYPITSLDMFDCLTDILQSQS
ncbi:MAG: hypothetical protein VW274_09655, partial [Thalassolituus sp.]